MKKHKEILPTMLIALLVQFAYSQISEPLWINEAYRDRQYPSSQWYVGFSQGILKSGENVSETLKKFESDAKNRMAQSVVVNISSQSTSETARNMKQQGQDIRETIDNKYKQAIRTSTNIDIAKAEVRSYHNSKTGYIYAFAVVKKKDLADFYRSNVNSLFSFADKEFAIAEQLAEQGKKKQALDKIYTIEDSLKIVGYWASLLQAVESDNSYATKETALWQKANSVKMQLQHGTAIYLNISGNDDYSDLDEQLGTQMQEKGCNCTIAEDKEHADYQITIKTKLNRCNENNYGEVYCYANANVVVDNSKYKKPINVKIPEAKGGWTNGNKDKATEEAFKELTSSLAEKIIQTINQ